MKFGSILHEKLGERGYNTISQRLRTIASFLQISQVKSMTDMIMPEQIDEAVRCAKILGGLSNAKNKHTELPEYAKPSKAMRIGGELRQLALLKKGIALETRKIGDAKDAEDFLALVDLYWNTRVAHVALQTREANKYDKVNVLPLTEDLKRFTEKSKEALLAQTAAGVTSKEEYISLTKQVLGRLLVFNKRRPTEVSRTLLSSWFRKDQYKKETISEIKSNMGRLEKQLYDKMDVVMVRGKCGNRVPVLVPEDAARAIESLIRVRDDFVDKGNKFLLAAPGANIGHYRGGQILKNLVQDMGMNQPQLFTATRLRKYCGTTSQMLALSDADFEILTRHMGHDKNVHRQYYRLPDSTLELTKAAVLMNCMDEGNVGKYAGKDLGTILDLGNQEDDDANSGAGPSSNEDQESQEKQKKTRNHQRFTLQQTNSLAVLLKARGHVPKLGDLRIWLKRQGRAFGGRTAEQVRAKLHNMMRAKSSRTGRR